MYHFDIEDFLLVVHSVSLGCGIYYADPDSEEFAARAKVLKDLIEHHAEEEETQMFPKARKAMGTAMLRELGEELQQRKQELSAGMSERNMERMTGNRRRVA